MSAHTFLSTHANEKASNPTEAFFIGKICQSFIN